MSEEQIICVKCYLRNEDGSEEARRFWIKEVEYSNFGALEKKIQTIFRLGARNFQLSWQDFEDEKIIISSDYELLEAIDVCLKTHEKLLKIYVIPDGTFKTEDEGLSMTKILGQQSLSVKSYMKLADRSEDIRRFAIPEDDSTTFTFLREKIRRMYNLEKLDYNLYWQDSEKEDIRISSDLELFEAIKNCSLCQGNTLLKIRVKVLQTSKKHARDSKIHPGVKCIGCGGDVCGIRFKCLTCKSLDLCSMCIEGGFHSYHQFKKISLPDKLEASCSSKPTTNALVSELNTCHPGVWCDNCGEDIHGMRHICVTCPDYDLCTGCLAKGIHNMHFFDNITSPMNLEPSFLKNDTSTIVPSPKVTLASIEESFKKCWQNIPAKEDESKDLEDEKCKSANNNYNSWCSTTESEETNDARTSLAENILNGYAFRLTHEEEKAKKMVVKYSSSLDVYLRENCPLRGRMVGWKEGVFSATNMFRKFEWDWRMVYLSRTEGSKKGEIRWRFDWSSSTCLRASFVSIVFHHRTYEDGEVRWMVCSDNKCFNGNKDGVLKLSKEELERDCSYLDIYATLQKGKTSVDWQHAQLFRQKEKDKDFPFCVKIKFS